MRGPNVAVKGEASEERREAARDRLVRRLERRWKHVTGMERFPPTFLPTLYRHPYFNELVERQVRSDGVSLPNLDFQPRVQRLPDGEIEDQLIKELGADPREFACSDCGVPIHRGDGRCDECHEWRRTGVTP